MKNRSDFGQVNHTPGQSSPRPSIPLKMNGPQFTSTSFIGPQLPPHMMKVPQEKQMTESIVSIMTCVDLITLSLHHQNSSYVNGNGSSKDYQEYHSGSKPNRSFYGGTKIGSGPSHSSSSASSSSSSTSLSSPTVRPMGIPDSSKRPKLTFLIGQGKPVRPAQTQSSPNCSASSVSHTPTSSSTSMTTSDVPQAKQVNGTHTGASLLVPYGQESSEESDQEIGASENGTAKPPKITNGNGVKDDFQAHSSSSLPQLTSKTNGSNGLPETHGCENGSGSARKSQNGIHKSNGFIHADKVQLFEDALLVRSFYCHVSLTVFFLFVFCRLQVLTSHLIKQIRPIVWTLSWV